MTIKTKLVLVLCLPVLVLGYMGFTAVQQKNTVKNDLSDIESLTTLAVSISDFIHETQKERGLTAGFIGSNGETLRADLLSQRENADGKNPRDARDARVVDASEFSERFQGSLSSAVDRLDDLERVRSSVLALEIPIGEALGYYTKNHTEFLETITLMVSEYADPTLSTQLTAYVNFLESKELAGIERAVLTGDLCGRQVQTGDVREAHPSHRQAGRIPPRVHVSTRHPAASKRSERWSRIPRSTRCVPCARSRSQRLRSGRSGSMRRSGSTP